MLRIRLKGRAIVIRTFGTSPDPTRARAPPRRTNPHARNHVRHHSSFRASREDRRRHHRQGRQRQVHDDLAPARQQVRERARSIEPARIFRERISPHRANVARPLRARARLGDAARAIFRRRQFFFDVLTPAIATRGVGAGDTREGTFGVDHPIARSGTRAVGYWVLGL